MHWTNLNLKSGAADWRLVVFLIAVNTFKKLRTHEPIVITMQIKILNGFF